MSNMCDESTHVNSYILMYIRVLQLCIPYVPIVRDIILSESHASKYAALLGIVKTIEMVRRNFYWCGLNKDVHEYVSACDICQRTKLSKQKQPGLLQSLTIPQRNWEQVTMDFVTGLPLTARHFDTVLVIVDKLSKMAHFIPTSHDISAHETAWLFVTNIFRLHGMPHSIISDRDGRFTSDFWQALFDILGCSLRMSSSYHSQTDGQSERTIQVLLQMIRATCRVHA